MSKTPREPEGATAPKSKPKRRPRPKGTGSIFKPKGSRFYWIAYMSGGKRNYESTKSTVERVAQDLLTSRMGDTQRGIVVTPKLGKIKLGDGLKAVTNDLTNNARKTADETKRRINMHLLKFFSPEQRMNGVTTANIEAYKTHRLEQKAAPATINRELAALRRAFRLAVRGGELLNQPHVALLRENNTRKGFFERDQLDAVLKHLPAELRVPVSFAYITGWRFKSEVLPLRAAQVDLKVGVVTLDVGTTKSGKGRSFYLTGELRALLKGQLDALEALKKRGTISTFVFHRPDGSEIKSLRKSWTNACEKAGCPGRILHDFRRTAVRNLERAGVPRSTAMAMVGHETESIYRRYAIVDETSHREGAAKLELWQREQSAEPAKASKGTVKRFRKANR